MSKMELGFQESLDIGSHHMMNLNEIFMKDSNAEVIVRDSLGNEVRGRLLNFELEFSTLIDQETCATASFYVQSVDRRFR